MNHFNFNPMTVIQGDVVTVDEIQFVVEYLIDSSQEEELIYLTTLDSRQAEYNSYYYEAQGRYSDYIKHVRQLSTRFAAMTREEMLSMLTNKEYIIE